MELTETGSEHVRFFEDEETGNEYRRVDDHGDIGWYKFTPGFGWISARKDKAVELEASLLEN
jgi:hypothetical protein